MNRLTRKSESGMVWFIDHENNEIELEPCEMDSHHSRLAIQKLAEYENMEENGLIIKIPCREVFDSIGDTVYYIYDNEVIDCINCGVTIDCESKLRICLACDDYIFQYRNPDPEHDLDSTDWCAKNTEVAVEECGKTVFFTKEQADKAMEIRGLK